MKREKLFYIVAMVLLAAALVAAIRYSRPGNIRRTLAEGPGTPRDQRPDPLPGGHGPPGARDLTTVSVPLASPRGRPCWNSSKIRLPSADFI